MAQTPTAISVKPQAPPRATAAADPRARLQADQARLTIRIAAVQENYLTLTEKMAAHQAYVAAVVKADCYGLGAARLAPALWAAGARVFFVAHLTEALDLRQTLPEAAIYIFSGVRRAEIPLLTHYRLIPVLNRLEEIELWLSHAAAQGHPIPAAIHIDTGMARLGLDAGELRHLKEQAELLKAFSPLLYLSHLANAERTAHEGNLVQLATFTAALSGLPPGQRSLANSSGCFLPRDYAFDLARPGAALYGLNPSAEARNPMLPVVTLSAPILQTRTLEKGETVGYGSTWTAQDQASIATLSLGYADGLTRALSNRGQVFIAGIPCPIVGRVSMDLITIDVSHLRADQRLPGTQAEIIGPNQSVDDLATLMGTIGNEVLTGLGSRLARSYVAHG